MQGIAAKETTSICTYQHMSTRTYVHTPKLRMPQCKKLQPRTVRTYAHVNTCMYARVCTCKPVGCLDTTDRSKESMCVGTRTNTCQHINTYQHTHQHISTHISTHVCTTYKNLRCHDARDHSQVAPAAARHRHAPANNFSKLSLSLNLLREITIELTFGKLLPIALAAAQHQNVPANNFSKVSPIVI